MRKTDEPTSQLAASLPAASTDVKLPTGRVAARYGVASRTVERWQQDPKLEFPKPLVINTRKYWSVRDLESWERRQP
jgi:hypothetical protein